MAIGGPAVLLAILGIIAGALLVALIFMYVLVPVLKGIGWIIGKFFWLVGAGVAHVFRFVSGMFRDTFRAIGAVPAATIFAFLAVGSVVIGRWSAAAHFGSNMQKEVKTFAGCIYRVALGHPLRLVGLHPLLEGIEERVPAAMAEAPRSDKPNRRTGKFEGYEIVGSLPGGGSGGKLYIAAPTIEKQGQIAKAFGDCPERVVIKSFAVADGSSIPQIVRESRALECAKQLGLILDHQLNDQRFYYVMPYVPGESLGAIGREVHSRRGDEGLKENDIREILGYLGDVLTTLDIYHRGGLWHKDIKPENIIISGDGRAHVVDLGLVTPLRSAMTLTTHGTEYFRDPEMVRMALKGVKVNEVDGAKFDLYAAGAVLFYLLENTFPSHGGLSTISKRCPEALKWIVRRGMTDYSKRYSSAAEMFEDVKTVATNPRMYAMRPIDLPSLRGGGAASSVRNDLHAAADCDEGTTAAATLSTNDKSSAANREWSDVNSDLNGGGVNVTGGTEVSAGPWNREPDRKKFRFKVTNWWTGGYEPAGEAIAVRGSRGGRRGSVRNELRHAAREAREAVRGARASSRSGLRQAARTAAAEMRRQRAAGRKGFAKASVVGAPFIGPRVGSPNPMNSGGAGASAHEQVARARARATELRRRARERASAGRHVRAPGERVSPGMVIGAAFVGCFLLLTVTGGMWVLRRGIGPSSFGIGITSTEGWPESSTVDTPRRRGMMAETWSRGGWDKWNEANTARESSETSPPALRSAYQINWPSTYPKGFLVVNDHPQPMNETVKDLVAKVESSLKAIGLKLTASQEGETQVRARVGQYLSGPYAITPGEELNEAEEAVGELMGSTLKGIGCVVWVYPVADQPDAVEYWVITPDGVNSTLDNHILAYLVDSTTH